MEHIRSIGAMVVTAPNDHEIIHELAVRLTREEASRLNLVGPQWVTIHANKELETVAMKFGRGVEDGA